MKPPVEFSVFEQLDIRAGVVVRAEAFSEARMAAIKLWVDFGEGVGVLPSSAQLTRRYSPDALVGTRVLGVVNFAPRRIAGFESRALVLGVTNPADPGDVVLVRPDQDEGAGWPLG